MNPAVTFDIFGLEASLGSYGLFMMLAAIIVFALSIYGIYKAGLPFRSSLLCLILMAVSLPVGARALNVAINFGYYMDNPHRILALDTIGFSLMGGLVLSGLVGVVLSRILGLDQWRLGDSVAPGLGLGLAVMRMGCFMNGCCFGLESDVPWAVRFPFDSPAHRHYISLTSGNSSLFAMFRSPSVHPTQVYEIIGSLIAALVAYLMIRKGAKPGVPVASAAIVFITARLINHFLRVHPSTNQVPFLFYPTVYLLIIVYLVFLLLRRIRLEN